VFSLGLVILILANLIRDYQNLNQEEARLQEEIKKLKFEYSNDFCTFLELMLIWEIDERPDFLLLAQIIK